ncbi:hypothetical protein [Streptomyces sp. NPDC002520]
MRRSAPEDVPELHRLAARWLADRAQTADAIQHLQSAGDWADAVGLLSEHVLSLTLDGQAGTVGALLRAVPAGVGDRELAPVHAMARAAPEGRT